MKKYLIISLVVLISFLSGCDSLQRKPSSYQSDYDIGSELNYLFKNYTDMANASIPDNFKFKYTQVAGYTHKDQITGAFELFSTNEKQHFFSPGAYLINRKATLAYAMFVSGIIDEVYKRYGSEYELLILADFWGSTDAAKFQHFVPYKGEFGAISIAKEELLLNGFQPDNDFLLNVGDALSNERLAVLRAYSMAWSIKHWPNRNKLALAKIEQSRFIAHTSNKMGQSERYAKIIIKVKRKSVH